MKTAQYDANYAAKRKGRVFIRPLSEQDCLAFLSAVRRSRSLHGPWITPRAGTEKEFSTYLERFGSDRHHAFLVVHCVSNEMVGVININEVIRGPFQSGLLGYYAFSPYAGQGLMFEGMNLVLKHAFRKLKLRRLEAHIQPGNGASIALVQKCGFIHEGLSCRLLKGGRWSEVAGGIMNGGRCFPKSLR
jgi:[ribosomal protein S5]-alanine N-acetyltransferase